DALTALLEGDPTNPRYLDIQKRLKAVSGILPKADGVGKAWNAVRLGVGVYIGASGPRNFGLAYDAFRFASELEPKTLAFSGLVAMFENDDPAFAASDPIPRGVGLLEYK